MKRCYKKCQILIFLKDVNDSVAKLTFSNVFVLISKLCIHSILLINQNILRIFTLDFIFGLYMMQKTHVILKCVTFLT